MQFLRARVKRPLEPLKYMCRQENGQQLRDDLPSSTSLTSENKTMRASQVNMSHRCLEDIFIAVHATKILALLGDLVAGV